ncbi:hypothetical protein ACIQUM_07940 [Amycolatopsis azurea]|uniref:hypothetical protein n=1 Tax=Amycolatopsis azurea TaxID=36819 RepID=UPI0037F70367
MGKRLARSGDIAGRLVPAIISAIVAIAAAAAGFHELPNVFQIESTLVAGLLAGVAAWNIQKKLFRTRCCIIPALSR